LVIFTVCFGVVASRWSFGDGSPDTTARYVAHAYTAPGTYTVVLTVTDDRGGWAAVSHSVEAVVSNSPPQAGFTSACAGLTCTFSDGSFDYDGTVVGYHWTFGDGESADGPHPVHTYAAPGVYHVQLVVTDDRSATGEAAQDVPAASPDDPVIGLVGAGLRFCVPFSGGSTRVCGARGAMGINNLGGGTLHWTATKSGAWLRILPQSGTTLPGMQSGMQVWVVDSGVAPGFYLGWIKISATGVINSPQTMPVYFTKR
jgi:chitodextrinase